MSILPYVEQATLFNRLAGGNRAIRSFADTTASLEDAQILQTPIAVYRCPSDVTGKLNPRFWGGSAWIGEHIGPTTTNFSGVAIANDVAVAGPGGLGSLVGDASGSTFVYLNSSSTEPE